MAAFDGQCRDPVRVQRELLEHYLTRNAETGYGRQYGFATIRSWQDYQREVPIVTYEDLSPYMDRLLHGEPGQLTVEAPVLFAMTSGTTDRSKFIPVTPESRAAKSRQMRIWLSALIRDHPRIPRHKMLTVVSPEVESLAPCGTPCGAESGHGYRNMPPPVQAIYSTPYEVFEISDYESKYYTLLRLACGQSVGMLYTLNPSTVVLMAQSMGRWTEAILRDVRNGSLRRDAVMNRAIRETIETQLKPDRERFRRLEQAASQAGGRLRPRDVWPDLQVICCWKGGTVGAYLEKFDSFFRPDTPVRDVGYFATEVRGSVVLTDEGSSGVLGIGTNVYEFWPVSESREPQGTDLLRVEQLEEGRQYFIYVTTHAGLYRYDMNDIIEVTGWHLGTPLVRFVQKGKGVVSFTGEKLYEAQVIAAVEESLAPHRGCYEFIAAVGQMWGDRPRYEFLIEFEGRIPLTLARQILARLDRTLGRHNPEYAVKRRSLRLADPVLQLVKVGSFNAYRRRMVEQGRSDGQFKTLKLTANPAYAREFAIDREITLEDPKPGCHSP